MTLACVCVALLFIHYAKFSSNIPLIIGDELTQRWQSSHWYHLLGYVWWTGCHLIGFVLLPWLVIRWCFKQRMRDFGWRVNDTAQHWRGYLLLPLIGIIVLLSMGVTPTRAAVICILLGLAVSPWKRETRIGLVGLVVVCRNTLMATLPIVAAVGAVTTSTSRARVTTVVRISDGRAADMTRAAARPKQAA